MITHQDFDQNQNAKEEILGVSDPKLENEAENNSTSISFKKYVNWQKNQGYIMTKILSFNRSLKYYNANQGVVITNSEFTPGAEELAKANNVILIDGKDLKKLADFTFEENHDEDVLKKFEK